MPVWQLSPALVDCADRYEQTPRWKMGRSKPAELGTRTSISSAAKSPNFSENSPSKIFPFIKFSNFYCEIVVRCFERLKHVLNISFEHRCFKHPTLLLNMLKTSRERPKSAPYPKLKNSKRTSNFQVLVNWENFYEKKFRKKSHNAEKTEREDPLVSSGIVCYAGNLFGSVPWATRYILASSVNFVELLVELFWSVQVYFGL